MSSAASSILEQAFGDFVRTMRWLAWVFVAEILVLGIILVVYAL